MLEDRPELIDVFVRGVQCWAEYKDGEFDNITSDAGQDFVERYEREIMDALYDSLEQDPEEGIQYVRGID